MKNTLEGINSTLPEPKNEQVTRKTMAEISATEQQQKKMTRNEDSFRDLWDNMQVTWVIEEEK